MPLPPPTAETSPPVYDPDAVCITCDVEWAHPEVLNHFLRLLEERNICATLFCTHPGIDAPRHELALHPNFSLSGDTVRALRPSLATLTDDEFLRHVVETAGAWYPDAVGVRGHRQYFDSALLPLYQKAGLRYDSSCFLPYASHLAPSMKPYGILELPIYFIDHSDLSDHRTGFEVAGLNLARPGIKVLDFHPNLVYLNASDLAHYTATKPFYHDPERLLAARHPGRGVGTLFVDLLDRLASRKAPTITLAGLNAGWRALYNSPFAAIRGRHDSGIGQ